MTRRRGLMIDCTVSAAAAQRMPFELVVPVCAAGVAAVGAGTVILLSAHASASELAGVLTLLCLAATVNRFPVPAGLTTISLASVFIVAAAVLYGSAAAAVISGVAAVFGFLGTEKPPIRIAFNASQAALAGGASGLAATAAGGTDHVLLSAIAGSVVFLGVNILLISSVIARADRRSLAELLVSSLRWVGLPFALSTSIVPLFVTAWESSRAVALSSAIPLTAIGLYLRSVAASRQVLELALTDPLTGLGNRRHFDERLRAELDRADTGTGVVSLVLIDLDGFKLVNDQRGHEAGDELLRSVAGSLRQGGEAFRLGGDEFALLLPQRGERDAEEVVSAVRSRLAPTTAGFGVASYPRTGLLRDELFRSADRALYRDKQSRAASAR
ncbi:MAG TPA: diguanylate cyclase [Gaiellaceae bacterium]|nr:diguanylate cyclase [Gaiellaceae bacterium]